MGTPRPLARAPSLPSPTGDGNYRGGFDEVGRSRSEPSSSSRSDYSSPPLDLRDAAVARVPASSGILFPPPSGELEGDGPRAVLYVFFLFLPCYNGFFFMLQQMIFKCCNEIFFVVTTNFLRCCGTTI
jgi:hypothetical protein